MKTLKTKPACWLFCLAPLVGFQSASLAQCTLPDPGTANVTIQAYYWINDSYTSPLNLAYLQEIVNVGNTTVPAGTYLGWCIDLQDSIGAPTGGAATYNTIMYSTCDSASTLDSDLAARGYVATDITATQAQWDAVNYILNNKAGTYWDIQCAIWNFIGGPISALGAGYPPVPTSTSTGASAVDVAAYWQMVNGANANPGFKPGPGQTVGVVVAIPGGYTGDPKCRTQVTIIECKAPQTVCCPPPCQQNCNGGSVWCCANLTCNPGKACTISCQNASVTFTCNNGKCYTYSLPNCQVNFNQNCWTPSCSFQNGQWCTTVPSCGDSQIFLTGCGIPWQNDFANCQSVCYTGTFNCSTPGVSCQWQCGSACYNCNFGNCNTIQVNPCYQHSCGYQSGDCAGTPENYKSYCSSGNNQGWNNQGWNNQGGNNYCGSWSGGCSFSWH